MRARMVGDASTMAGIKTAIALIKAATPRQHWRRTRGADGQPRQPVRMAAALKRRRAQAPLRRKALAAARRQRQNQAGVARWLWWGGLLISVLAPVAYLLEFGRDLQTATAGHLVVLVLVGPFIAALGWALLPGRRVRRADTGWGRRSSRQARGAADAPVDCEQANDHR